MEVEVKVVVVEWDVVECEVVVEDECEVVVVGIVVEDGVIVEVEDEGVVTGSCPTVVEVKGSGS